MKSDHDKNDNNEDKNNQEIKSDNRQEIRENKEKKATEEECQEKKTEQLLPTSTESFQKNQRIRQFERLSKFTIIILFIAASITFFPIIRLFFIPIILAATLAGLFTPLYRWLYNHLWHKPYFSSLICCFILILGVLIPAYILIKIIIDQFIIIYNTAEPWLQMFATTWRENRLISIFLNSNIGRWLSNEIDWDEIGQVLFRNLGSFATIVANRTYTGIFGLFVDLVIMVFVLFYFLIDGSRILKRISYLLPLKQQYQEMAYSRFLLISEATIKGTFIIGAVDGLLGALTLLIFGIDTWLVWGFIIMIFSILPLVGPSFVLLPAGIIQIIVGNVWQGIGILVVTYTIVINADNVIRPRVVGSRARMHELLVFFSTLGGLSVYGITGFIIGPVIASFLLTIIDIYAEEFRPQLSGR